MFWQDVDIKQHLSFHGSAEFMKIMQAEGMFFI